LASPLDFCRAITDGIMHQPSSSFCSTAAISQKKFFLICFARVSSLSSAKVCSMDHHSMKDDKLSPSDKVHLGVLLLLMMIYQDQMIPETIMVALVILKRKDNGDNGLNSASKVCAFSEIHSCHASPIFFTCAF
jgi:hypothetical protein